LLGFIILEMYVRSKRVIDIRYLEYPTVVEWLVPLHLLVKQIDPTYASEHNFSPSWCTAVFLSAYVGHLFRYLWVRTFPAEVRRESVRVLAQEETETDK